MSDTPVIDACCLFERRRLANLVARADRHTWIAVAFRKARLERLLDRAALTAIRALAVHLLAVDGPNLRGRLETLAKWFGSSEPALVAELVLEEACALDREVTLQ